MAYLKDEIKAGAIIVASLIVLTVFIILIGGRQFFEKFDNYYVMVMNAGDLEAGAQVKLGGVRVGRVLSIRAPEGPGKPVTIEIGIKKGTALYKGTRALITQIGFVGDTYLLLSVDKTSSERLKVGAIIPSDEQVQFTMLMARLEGLSQSVDGLIRDIDRLFSQRNIEGIERLVGNTNKAIASGSSNLDKVASGLKGTTDKLQLVLDEVEKLVRGNKADVSQMIKKAREDLDKAGDMIRTMEQTAKTVDKTSRSVDRAIDLQSQNLDNLLNTMTRTTEDLQDVLQEIKNKPWSILYKGSKGKED